VLATLAWGDFAKLLCLPVSSLHNENYVMKYWAPKLQKYLGQVMKIPSAWRLSVCTFAHFVYDFSGTFSFLGGEQWR
jgi:hypothetical protein